MGQNTCIGVCGGVFCVRRSGGCLGASVLGLTHQSGASLRLQRRNIWDRVLASVSLSAASALYCFSPSVTTSCPRGGQRSEKVHSVSLCLDKFWQIYFSATHCPPPRPHPPHAAEHICSSLIDKITSFPNLNMTHILTLKPTWGCGRLSSTWAKTFYLCSKAALWAEEQWASQHSTAQTESVCINL